MNIEYDPEVNAMSIRFREDSIVESDEIRPGVIVDYSADGKVVSMEILDAYNVVSGRRLTKKYSVNRKLVAIKS